MTERGGTIPRAVRVAIALLAVAGVLVWRVGADGVDPRAKADGDPASASTSSACSGVVLQALRDVVGRVYAEGLRGETAATAAHFIVTSGALREAVERDDPAATRRAAEGVLATNHLTDLRITRGGRVLANVGAPQAIAPVQGTLSGARGRPIGTYLMSVWSDVRFLAQAESVTEARIALRAGQGNMGGSFPLPPGQLPPAGSLTQGGVAYGYTSIPARAYPAGTIAIYLLLPAASTARFCAASSQDILLNTIEHVAGLIYQAETGPRASLQIVRVQHDPALLRAVSRRDPAATRRAVDALLNQHVVRLRVLGGGRLLADVGGPFVLGPRAGTLSVGGRAIGRFVLSIQDDLGYLLLARRLAGLQVVMRRAGRVVMNSLGPHPPPASLEGSYRYHGHRYRVFTLHATAFPSGPLRIAVFMPIPYS